MTRKTISYAISAARTGKRPDAGLDLLKLVADHIDTGQFSSAVFPYLSNCIRDFLEHDELSLEDAFNIKGKKAHPLKYSPMEQVATDLILRRHVKLTSEEALEAIMEMSGEDRRGIQRKRKGFEQLYQDYEQYLEEGAFGLDDLLHLSGTMRKKVSKYLPQT